MISETLSNTARIGLIDLKPAMILAENFKEYKKVYEIDRAVSGCSGCSYCSSALSDEENALFGVADYDTDQIHYPSEQCKNCKSKKLIKKIETTYINEKNMYGTPRPLKKYALLLFIYLQFRFPDQHGFVELDVKDAAEFLGCDAKTVKNNLHLLSSRNFIAYQKGGYPGHYYIFISKYEEYFKNASGYGKGYLLITKEIFSDLIQMPTINHIRACLNAYINDSKKLEHRYNTIEKLKYNLPNYVTKKELLDFYDSKMFQHLFSIDKDNIHSIRIKVNGLSPIETANKLIADCKTAIESTLEKINTRSDQSYAKINGETILRYPPFMIRNSEIKALSKIGRQYPISGVTFVLEKIYQEYIVPNVPIENLEALTRTYLKNIFNPSFIAA